MTKPEARINDESRMTTGDSSLGHSAFGFDSDFWVRHSGLIGHSGVFVGHFPQHSRLSIPRIIPPWSSFAPSPPPISMLLMGTLPAWADHAAQGPRLALKAHQEFPFATSRTRRSPGGESYLFVMEDSESKKVIGACGIVSKVGGFQPFYGYRIETRSSRASRSTSARKCRCSCSTRSTTARARSAACSCTRTTARTATGGCFSSCGSCSSPSTRTGSSRPSSARSAA